MSHTSWNAIQIFPRSPAFSCQTTILEMIKTSLRERFLQNMIRNQIQLIQSILCCFCLIMHWRVRIMQRWNTEENVMFLHLCNWDVLVWHVQIIFLARPVPDQVNQIAHPHNFLSESSSNNFLQSHQNTLFSLSHCALFIYLVLFRHFPLLYHMWMQ